jgi:hypothetical protein
MWEYAGMARNEPGLNKAIGQIQDLRDDFNKNLLVTGHGEEYNMELERSGRVRDFFDFGEFSAAMLWTGMNHAVDISGRSIKQRTGKLPVTTRILLTLRSGNIKAMGKLLPVTKKI